MTIVRLTFQPAPHRAVIGAVLLTSVNSAPLFVALVEVSPN